MKQDFNADIDFEFFFNLNTDIICILSLEGTFVNVNPACENLLIYSKAELSNKTIYELTAPSDLLSIKSCMEGLISGIKEIEFTSTLINKSGENIYIEWRLQPAEGFIYAVGKDISSLKWKEANLALNQLRFEAMIASKNIYIMRFTPDFTYTFVNPKYIQSFGWLYNNEPLIGNSCSISLRPENIPPIKNIAIKCVENPGVAYQIELLELTPNNQPKYTIWELVGLLDEEGKVTEIQALGVDITERKISLLANRAEESNSILELSTPIAALWDGILLLPLVGAINLQRAQSILKIVLQKLTDTQAQILILDVSGVPNMDKEVANYLIKLIKAVKLMGCDCTISGISPEVAQVLLALDIDTTYIHSSGSMQEALKDAFLQTGSQVIRLK